MKALFIGGTGNISGACSQLALARGFDLTILSRGQRSHSSLSGATYINADVNQQQEVKAKLKGAHFDVVVNYIAYTPEEVKRDIQLF